MNNINWQLLLATLLTQQKDIQRAAEWIAAGGNPKSLYVEYELRRRFLQEPFRYAHPFLAEVGAILRRTDGEEFSP